MRNLFNENWKFALEPITNISVKNGEKPVIFDPCNFFSKRPNSYNEVNIPHDWLISDTNDLYKNSIGYYQKKFNLTKQNGKKYALCFEGIYMNSAVYVNEKLACVWKYGYSTFEFDITNFVIDGENTIDVIAVYQSPNSRWYSGAGIFRDVYFVETEDARITFGGVYFSASPLTEEETQSDLQKALTRAVWNVSIDTEISGNYKNCTIRQTIYSEETGTIKYTQESNSFLETKIIQPAMGVDFNSNDTILINKFIASVKNPELWSCENPFFYILKTELIRDGIVIDQLEQHVGFKTITFDSNKGCFINGEYIKLHGVCEHHDFGSLGSAFNITAARRKFIKLRKMGVNSIRTSHNPQAPAFIDLADEMGFLIVDECFDMWEKPKTTYDYGNYFIEWHERDTMAWVRRDRNHPCLLMWSIGNEIYDTHSGNGYAITQDLSQLVRTCDPNKNGLITIGSNYLEWEGAQHCAEVIDVVGYNYGEHLYDEHHKKFPEWKIYGSETGSTVQSRGIYRFPLSNRLLTYIDNQCSSLGNCSTNWGAPDSAWAITQDRDAEYCAGQYIWTGWDYIGEPTPYFTKNSFFGQIDTAGFEKDTYYEYVSSWVDYKESPFVHLLPDWDYNEGQLIDVRIYSNAPFVELFVNGESLGKKENNIKTDKKLASTWTVPFHKGKITAVAYDLDENIIAGDERYTPDESSNVELYVEEESGDGIYFIDIWTTDKNNHDVSNARNRIFMAVEGDAELIGTDNGDSTDYEQYQPQDKKTHNRRLFNNRLVAIVKAKTNTSSFKFIAESKKLNGNILIINNGVIDRSEIDKEKKQSQDLISKAKVLASVKEEIPVRRIELICSDDRTLTPQNKTVKVKAIIHPFNATDKKLNWLPMILEGVKSDSADICVTKIEDGEEAVITATNDGEFRLSCTAQNKKDYPEVISELEFSVKGLGKSTRDPYKLIEAIKCSSSSNPVKLSFQGGVFTEPQRSWFSFDRVDFGTEGSDTITLPIFSFSNEVNLEIWEGNPDKNGKLLLSPVYKAESWYNHYQSNTFTFPRRLFGVHEITILFNNRMSLQGFVFEKSQKAFSKLCALDCNTVVGDSFVKENDAITGIGNNVTLEYLNMNFTKKNATRLTICGNAHVDNSIHVKFINNNDCQVRLIEFKKTDGYVEKTFNIEQISGEQKVDFVFLPGSSFDFKWFKFD